jgi:hypothetical protein
MKNGLLRIIAVCCALLWAAPCPAQTLKQVKTWRVGDAQVIVFTLQFDPDGFDTAQRLQVVAGGAVVASVEDQRIVLDRWISAPKGTPFPSMGTNLTGGTSPQLLVQGHSGGAHCCTTLHLIDLDSGFRNVELPIGGHYFSYLRRQPGEAGWIAVGHDGTFAYWKTDFVQSPAPQVLFRPVAGTWTLAADLMRKPAPSAEDVAKWTGEVRKAGSTDKVPPRLWEVALDLAYSGHLALAERFVDLAWRDGFPGREEFRRDLFSCRLRRSPVWPALAEMNGREALPPDESCPEDDGG